MDQCHGLPVASQQAAGIHVRQDKPGSVVLNLHRHRVDILPTGKIDGDLEGSIELLCTLRWRHLQGNGVGIGRRI